MNQLINKLIDFLKEHVSQNNKEIQFNQQEIDKLLSDISLNPLKKDLDTKYNLNRQLLNENADFVKMQLELSEFLEKYKHLFPADFRENSLIVKDEDESGKLLMQTVNGKLKFDTAHPQFDNPRFFQALLKYYESHEDYEMCDKLLKIRKL
jgi:hypothetical protein